jgi:hypothetical protein
VADIAAATTDAALAQAAQQAEAAVNHARRWLQATAADRTMLEAGARRFGLTLGRALALALLIEAAEWSLEHEHDGRARAAALRFARTPIDLIADADPCLDAALANDEPLSVI